MENTIKAQDHPLVAVANRNVQTIAEYKYFEEMCYDIDMNVFDIELSPMDLLLNQLFDEDVDDLPF